MSISQDSSKKLFKIPTVVRVEPRVDNSDTVVERVNTAVVNADIDIARERSDLFLSGFSMLKDEYQKLIDVLKKRADYRNISMPIGKLALNDQSLSSAMNTLYGTQLQNFTFDNYVDLSIYEQKIATDFIGSNIESVMSVDDAKNIYKSAMSDPISHSISVVKSEFKKYCIENDARDLLLADTVVSESSSAGTAIANIQTTPSASEESDKTKQDKLAKLLSDCIPCDLRSLGTMDDYKNGPFFELFWQNIVKNFLARVATLLRMKLTLTGMYFTPDICSIVNGLTNFTCLPDLMALLSLFKILLFKFKKLFDIQMSGVSAGANAGTMAADMLVGSALEVLMTLLTRLSETVLSPIECLITALEAQLRKFDVGDFASSTNNAINSAYQEYYNYALKGKDYITTLIEETRKEIDKHLRLSIGSGDAILDIYENIDKLQNYINLTLEMIKMFDELKSAKLGDSNIAQKLTQAICKTAITQRNPWIQVLDDLGDELGDDSNPPDSNPPDGGDPGSPITEPGGGVLITDPTIPPGFFDDPWITIARDPITQNILNGIDFNNVENGDDILNFDFTKIDKYLAATHVSRTYPSTTNVDHSGSPLLSMPIAYIDFDACIKANNLSDYSEQQIQDWINQVK